MRNRLIIAVLMAFFGVSLILAQDERVSIFSHRENTFVNTDCKRNNTCDLKKIKYIVEDYRVGIDGSFNYGTRFFARYETKKVKDLEKYVFVQFIKGCNYSSRLNNGEIEIAYDRMYPRDAGAIIFKFEDWVIDSYDFDPVYSAFPGMSRFYGNRWNKVMDSFSTETEVLYGKRKPQIPELYIVDHPGQAFYLGDWAHSISLKFKTCMYKTKDVPNHVPHGNVNFAEPISCYEWGSSFAYNHLTNQFDSYPEIAQACR